MSVFPFMVFLFFLCELILAFSVTKYYAELPDRITALSGSCVQIPCTFDAPETIMKIFGFWIKKNQAFLSPDSLVVFNGSTNIIKGFSHIEILGNLSQRECTTVFYDVTKNHTDKYYFRVEMNPVVWKYTYKDNPIYITVSDVPEPPILTPTDLQQVMEQSTVNLSCSAEAPCPKQPPTISWSNIPESANITTQLQEKFNKTQSVVSYVTFKASYKDHRKNISCTATYPRNTSNDSTVESTVMLQVLFPPKETHITVDPSDSVSIGTNVTLTCKSKASPSNGMVFSWYKWGETKRLDYREQMTFGANITNAGWYFCIAENKYGIQKSKEIQLFVAGPLESSVPLIAGSVGGVSALLLLILLATLSRRVQQEKASRESIIREPDHSDQLDTIYVNDFMRRK